ncbi:cytochrome P450 3A11 [Aplysia californica]|uniref:Cytochrome P450 3A11 n=1 Tax=Aplysia californica TaxID=6500 RepID=A0ABM0JIF2_APLCA|nr:cytochrome P450 3A11 [Aplysia californica]
MELSILTIFLLCCVASLLLYVWYMSKDHGLFRKLGLPGPTPWPVVGNMMQEMGGAGLFDFHVKMYKKYKKNKVYGVFRAKQPALIVCDLDMIRDICVKHFNNFVNRQTFDVEPPLGNSLLELKDDHWKTVRATVSPSFSTTKLRKMYPHIVRNTQLLLEHLKEKHERNEPVELRDLLSAYTMDMIASTGFGVEINSLKEGENEFTKSGKALLGSFGRFIFLAMFVNFLRPVFKFLGITLMPKDATEFFTRFIDKALESRKHEKGGGSGRSDFIQIMLDAEHEDHTEHGNHAVNEEQENGHNTETKKVLSYSDIQGQAFVFFLAGYDTVATVLSFTMFLICMNPECLKKAQEEVDKVLEGKFPDYDSVQSLPYIEMCMNEAMRMYPPGFILDRICDKEIEIQGIKIPAGMNVTFPVHAIHHDPELWSEPEKFDPERFTPENKAERHPYAFLPFGQGPRNCIGMRLGLLEVKVAVAAMLQTLSPVPCEKTVYPFTQEKLQVKAVEGLWIKFEPRKKLVG